MDLVRSKSGAAVAGDFDSGRGTPVVVDTATGICYVVTAAGAIKEIGSILSSLTVSGQITSTLATGTAPFVIASTTEVANLNVASLKGANWAAPGTIGSTTPNTGAFTTLSASGLISADGGQIKFPATAIPSTNANTLDDYEEGTWTPIDSSGASLTFTAAVGSYTKIGRLCIAQCTVVYPTTASGLAAIVGGLPFTLGTSNGGGGALYNTGATAGIALAAASTTLVAIVKDPGAGTGVTNAQLSTFTIAFAVLYEVA